MNSILLKTTPCECKLPVGSSKLLGNPDWYIAGMEEETTLKIGSNSEDKVYDTITLTRDMQPTTYTVNIENAEQLVFFLECGDATSAPYAIYDIIVEK